VSCCCCCCWWWWWSVGDVDVSTSRGCCAAARCESYTQQSVQTTVFHRGNLWIHVQQGRSREGGEGGKEAMPPNRHDYLNSVANIIKSKSRFCPVSSDGKPSRSNSNTENRQRFSSACETAEDQEDSEELQEESFLRKKNWLCCRVCFIQQSNTVLAVLSIRS